MDTEKLTHLFLHNVLDKQKFEARLTSLRRIEKQIGQIEKMKQTEENMDQLLEKILGDKSEETIQSFVNDLSCVADALPIVNSRVPIEDDDMEFTPIQDSFNKITESFTLPHGPLRIMEDVNQSLESLQNLQNKYENL